MHLPFLFAVFALLALPLHSEIEAKLENNKSKTLFSKETKKNKVNAKKKNKEDPSLNPPKPPPTFPETFQKIVELSFEKCRTAQEMENSIVRTYANEKEVADTLHQIADLYRSASQIIKENLKITQFLEKKEILDQQICSLAYEFDRKTSSYTHQALKWPEEVRKKRKDIDDELEALKDVGKNLAEKQVHADCQEIYTQIATILATLVENGVPDHGELEEYQKKIIELAASSDPLHLKDQPKIISQEKYLKNESSLKNYFYYSDMATKNNVPSNVIPLDGQSENLYLGQFYRYLIHKDQSPKQLKVKVFENDNEIYDEIIEISHDQFSWENYLSSNDLLFPQSCLNSQYGLHLRLKIVLDPTVCFSLIISQKGTDTKYHYSFYLDDEPLYDLHFIQQLPWQLGSTLKPESKSIDIHNLSKINIESYPINDYDTPENPIEVIDQPYANNFIKEMKGDPLALAQYVHNEIELVDPFHIRDVQGVFQAPSIQRSPDRTFLDKKGSPWEQCALLSYLIKRAGFKTKYIEGPFVLQTSFAEQLLFMQFPGEKEIILNYPGVMFFDGEKWNALFPWMKEIDCIEGHDLYSLLPKEYASAERWLKQYLCNDKNILKHIGPDGDDTVGVLLVRHLEEHLRNQGLSLQDIGTHRYIRKKQYNTWKDFPHPQFNSEIRASEHLPNRIDIFTKIKITIQSEQNPDKKITINNLNLSAFSLSSFALYFTPNEKNGDIFHFNSLEDWNLVHRLILDNTDKSLSIEVLYETFFGPKDSYSIKKNFHLSKGSVASLVLNQGSSNDKITSIYADKFTKKQPDQQKLNALLSFIGSAYFEKCYRAEEMIAKLHKISPKVFFRVGLSKLSPGEFNGALKFPQVDMCQFQITQNHNKHPFSKYQHPKSSEISYSVLCNADSSSNEHQILREIYQDPNAISTVKLLQIAHQNHQKKGLPGPGFLIFTNKSFVDTNANPEKARLTHFSLFSNVDLRQLKINAASQWKMLSTIFEEDQKHSYAYVTPGPISSLDGYSLRPPSYTGIGTLFFSNLNQGALISDGTNFMNGGYGTLLPNNFIQTITNQDLKLSSSGTNYSLFPSSYGPLFNGTTSYHPSYDPIGKSLPVFSVPNEPHHLFSWKNKIWTLPTDNISRADVRPNHKTLFSVVSDPVDVITGAFYVDELDLTLPGPFPLELRRNYSSQNSLPGLFGFGWKLSFNPYLQEDGDKIFVAEQDGTVIVYRYQPDQNLWIVLPEDNPELNNFNSKGIGSIANPYHAYIENKDGYILHGVDGSKRIFENNLLKSWSDHAGNTLNFFYENELLKRIESSNHGFISFDYNFSGKICEVYAKDGRRVSYTYDSQGNLSSVILPNGGNVKYEYDRFHRIIRETKPHGHVLENIYQNNKVVEQRSPVGPYQQMVTSATFGYENGITKVTDPNGNVTEYKIYNHQIYKITDPEGNQTFQSWFLDRDSYFDSESEVIKKWNQPGAYPRSLKSSKDKRGLLTTYLYDENGNVQEICLEGDDLNGNNKTKISKYFTYNLNQLCIEERTLHTKTVTSYDFNDPYLPRRIEKYSDDYLISFVEMDYTKEGLVKQKNHSGTLTLIEYDNRNFPTKITQKTGTEDPDVVTTFVYNDQGQCVDQITEDALIHNEYDIMGNQCYSTTLSNSGKILSKISTAFDLNNRMIWKKGIDPNDQSFFDYNASGLIKATRKHLSNINDLTITPNGIAYTLYEYDRCGHLIEQTDPLGNATEMTNDSLGRVIESSKNGLKTTFTYEAGGLVSTTTSPNGAKTTNLYTTNGLLKTKICPDGSQICHVYDHFGRIIEEEKNGIKITVSYNDTTLEETRIEGEFTEIRKLDSQGNLISFTDKAGFTTRKTYDALGRIKTETLPNGDQTEWKYHGDTVICIMPNKETTVQRYEANQLVESKTFSEDGLLLSETYINRDPEKSQLQEISGQIVKTTWMNTLGLPIGIQQNDQFTTKTYDACGNCIATIDEEGKTIRYEFDELSRMIKKILPDGAVIHYEYDKNSNLIAYHMPGDLTWKATYDINDRKTAEWQEFNGKPFERWEYTYQNNLLIQLKDPQNRTHDYQYDSHNRLKKEIIDNSIREYTYDPRGMIASVKETGIDISIIERSYDEIGRIVHEDIFLNGVLLQSTNQAWTSTSRSLQINDHKRNLDYQGGRLKSLSTGNINLSYDYSIQGTLVQKKTPLSTVDIAYNKSLLPKTADIQISNTMYHESLSWTDSKKLKTHESTYPHPQNETFDYSERGYLKTTNHEKYSFDFENAGIGMRTSSPNLKALTLDEFGRINKELLNSKSVTTTYNSLGQVILHNRDLITWDSWGRIVGIKSDKYEWKASYDAFGRRLQTTFTPLKNYFLYKSKGNSVVTQSFYDPEHEFLEIGIERDGETLWKLYGPNACDAIIDSNNQAIVLHHDIRNNLKALISYEDFFWNEDYPSPYGPRAPPAIDDFDIHNYAKSLLWQSKQMDPTGLIWLGARYYDPVQGRFLSPDPISHPATLDLYTYANGDPINHVDLDGRFSSQVYRTTKYRSLDSITYSIPVVSLNETFEETHAPKNRSRNYDLSHLGRPELPDGLAVGLINGIQNKFRYARKTAIYISDLIGGYNIHAVYSSTMGFYNDLEACLKGLKNEDTGRIRHIHEAWDTHFDQYPDGYFLQFCHSRGAIDVCNALLCYSEERRQRIVAVAIAPGGYIYSETCAQVTHYRVGMLRDYIPYADKNGEKREFISTITLKSAKDAPFHDHTILSPTYRNCIQQEFEQFIRNKGPRK